MWILKGESRDKSKIQASEILCGGGGGSSYWGSVVRNPGTWPVLLGWWSWSSEISSRCVDPRSGREHWAERTQTPRCESQGFLIVRVSCDRKKGKGAWETGKEDLGH